MSIALEAVTTDVMSTDYAIEAVILARVELKVSCRRLENLAKAVGDTGVAS